MDLNGYHSTINEDAITMNLAIKNLTLADPAAVAEFHRRRATFAADTSLPLEIRVRGLQGFDFALEVDLPRVLKEGTPVVRLLRRTIRALGALYQEHFQRVADNQRQSASQNIGGDENKTTRVPNPDEEGSSDTSDVIRFSSATSISASQPVEMQALQYETMVAKQQRAKDLKRRRRVSAYALHAELARRKVEKERAKHGHEVSGSLQFAASPASNNFTTSTAAKPPISEFGEDLQDTNDESEDEMLNTPHPHPRSTTATTQSIIDRKVPKATKAHLQKVEAKERREQAVIKNPAPRKTNEFQAPGLLQTTTTSSTLVTGQSSASATIQDVNITAPSATTHVYARSLRPRTPKQLPLAALPFPTHAIPSQKPSTKVTTPHNSLTNTPSLIVKLRCSALNSAPLYRPPPPKPDTAKRTYGQRFHPTAYEESSDDNEGRSTKNRKSARESHVKSADYRMSEEEDAYDFDTSTASFQTTTLSSHLAPTPILQPSPTLPSAPPPPFLHSLTLPPYLPSKPIEPFHRGVTIALENIRDDSAAGPRLTLREVVEGLEAEMPVVKHVEYVRVLEGGMWVYGVMRGFWGTGVWSGAEGEAVGVEDKAGGDTDIQSDRSSNGDEDVDVTAEEEDGEDMSMEDIDDDDDDHIADDDHSILIAALVEHMMLWVEAEYARLA